MTLTSIGPKDKPDHATGTKPSLVGSHELHQLTHLAQAARQAFTDGYLRLPRVHMAERSRRLKALVARKSGQEPPSERAPTQLRTSRGQSRNTLTTQHGDLHRTDSLRAAGIAIITKADWDDPAVGRFARIHDPEGNAIELWEPPAQSA